MAIDFKLPDLGENVTAGDVVNVLVQEGDQVQPNQGLVELETDKAVIEVPCPHAGRVTKVHVRKGQTVPVGGLLVSLEPAGNAAASAPATPAADPSPAALPPAALPPAAAQTTVPRTTASPASPPPVTTPSAAPPAASAAVGQAAPASTTSPAPIAAASGAPSAAGPATRRFARELGVDLSRVSGSGPGGRITRDDILDSVRRATSANPGSGANGGAGGTAQAPVSINAPLPAGGPATAASPRMASVGIAGSSVADQDAWGPIVREPLTKIRKTIAANMARSHGTIPHVTNFDDADITELERIRKGSMADYVDKSVKLTMMPFVLKAVAHALKMHPAINATLDLEAGQAIYKQYVNLGVAVDTERGLVVPVLRHVDRMTIPQIAQALSQLAVQSRANQFALDDLRGGTFTISNLGAIGGTYSTPIINYPEVAILLVGRSRKLPVVVEDQIEPRLMMPLSLSYDHRWIDGATAARFLNEVKSFLESPGRLLLAP